MSASQNHGFIFEDAVIKSITGFSKEDYQSNLPNRYTASMDISKNNYSDHNFSIKVVGKVSTVGCGDILRFYDHCAQDDFFMVVGVWHQTTYYMKRYNSIHEIKFEPKNFSKIWGTIQRQDLEQFVSYVKSIPHGKAGQMAHRNKWKAQREQLLSKSQGHIIKIDAKIDSKTQRRVQCSLNINLLTTLGFPSNIYTTNYRGIILPYEQESKPRNF